MISAENTLVPAAPSTETVLPSRLRINLTTFWALVVRDLKRFFRQRSRVVGALVQPLIFWAVIGGGLNHSFRIQGAEGIGYVQYFFPGIVLLVVLFTAIFSTMSIIEDRHKGFLQAVLVAPADRAALVLGKTFGGVCIAMAQVAVFLALMPLGGYSYSQVDVLHLALILVGTAVGLGGVGFAVAWWLDSTQGYHVVMSVFLIPLWILSGAMFPAEGAAGWISVAMRFNPLFYAQSGVRRALSSPAGLSPGGPWMELAVVAGLALVGTLWAARAVRPGRGKTRRRSAAVPRGVSAGGLEPSQGSNDNSRVKKNAHG